VKFVLTYKGDLPAKSRGISSVKHSIRKQVHPQLKNLWERVPLNSSRAKLVDRHDGNPNEIQLSKNVGNFRFVPLVSSRPGWDLVARLDILFLRPSAPGDLIRNGGDLDNRIKLLIDSLRLPSLQELPDCEEPSSSESPFFVLLEDDALVVQFSVETETLLHSNDATSSSHVELIIRVDITPRTATWENIGI